MSRPRVMLITGDSNADIENHWNRVPATCGSRHHLRGLDAGCVGDNRGSVCDGGMGSPFRVRNRLINSWLWRYVR